MARQPERRHDEQPTLERTLGLTLVTLYGLGNILGAGIYVLVGKVVGVAGLYAPLAFVIAAGVAALAAFSYGELAARYPVSAGEAVYVQNAFRLRPLSIVVGCLIALAGMVSAATLARGFVGYFHVFFTVPGWPVVVLLVAAMGLVAWWGIGESVRVAAVLTVIEVGGLLLVVAVAGNSLTELGQRLPELVPPADPWQWHGIFLGAFLAFYAFIGFEDMVNVAEEVESPERNLPLGILLALIVSTVLYVLVVLVSVFSVAPEHLAQSDAPLALVYSHATGAKPVVITAIGLFAVINGALIQIIMASRVLYGMSANGWLPAIFARVDPRTRTPAVATVLVTVMVMALALWFPLVKLAGATSLLILVVFSLVNLALVRIKAQTPRVAGVQSIPIWIPVAGFVASLGLLLTQLGAVAL